MTPAKKQPICPRSEKQVQLTDGEVFVNTVVSIHRINPELLVGQSSHILGTHAGVPLTDRPPATGIGQTRLLQHAELWVLTTALGGRFHQVVTAANVILTDGEVR